MPNLTQQDGVHVLELGDTENRFSPDWLTAINEALDEVAANPAPLVTLGTGKQYSGGLDLDWLGANPDQWESYVARVHALLARVLTLPVPTIAALNGHAFAAGAMLALAHDWRLMRADRGFFCLPEVDIQIPFTPGMDALIRSKLTPRTAVDSMTTGYRYPGPEALAAGIVDGLGAEDELRALAIAKVAGLQGKHTDTLGTIKATMFAEPVRLLTQS